MTTGAAILTGLSRGAAHTGGSVPLWQGAGLAVAFGVRLAVSVRAFGAGWFSGIREDDLRVARDGPDGHDPDPADAVGAEHEERIPG